MNRPQLRQAAESNRVIGEDTPAWLTFVLAFIAVVVAAAAVWLWLTRHPVQSVGIPAPQPSAQTPQPDVPSGPARTTVAGATTATEVPSAQPAAPVTEPASVPAPQAQAVAPSAPEGASGQAAPESMPAPTGAMLAPTESETAAVNPVSPAPVPPSSASAPDRIVRDEVAQREPCPNDVSVRFEFGKADPILADARAGLQALADWLGRHPQVKVSVQGHTDAIGAESYNFMLSYQRAVAVAGVLRDAGVPAAAIIVGAAGSHEPVAGLPATAGENRRALVQVMNVGDCQPGVR